jgi:toxin ParE1/3/4
MQVVWAEPALRDLAAVRAYIAQGNVPAAERQVQRVILAVVSLLQFPEVGRPGRRAGTRELVVNRTPFIVAYRLRGGEIQVLRILHGRQRWPEAF